jgi:hypothetical protein
MKNIKLNSSIISILAISIITICLSSSSAVAQFEPVEIDISDPTALTQYTFTYGLDSNCCIHYYFRDNIPSIGSPNPIYRVYANDQLLTEGSGTLSGTVCPSSTEDINLTVHKKINNEWSYVSVNITVTAAQFDSCQRNRIANWCTPNCDTVNWKQDTMVLTLGDFYKDCPIKYHYEYRVCGDEIQIRGISYEMDTRNGRCNMLIAFIASECFNGVPASDGELEYSQWMLGAECFWFKLFEYTADSLFKQFYDGILYLNGGDSAATNEALSCDSPDSRSLHVSYYMGGCAAHIFYSYADVNGNIKYTGAMIDCTDGFACCKRSRKYCIKDNGEWQITIENNSSGATVLCNPSTTLPPPPTEAIIYFMKDCSPTCK